MLLLRVHPSPIAYILASFPISQNIRAMSVKIYCAKCNALLYKYHKKGSGHLIKCYKDRIVQDFTRGDLNCPECGGQFAREAMIHGKPANKIIQGKVFVRR